jgi:flavin reductase (DIM6/NTAB) family NADH-FMN oxidoreductase RutF
MTTTAPHLGPGRPDAPDSPGELLRRTLRQHAAGVTVITVPGPAGFTATSFTSVSLAPALVSFCLGRTASTLPAVTAASHFAVHLLQAEDAELAQLFARSGADRFASVSWSLTTEGVPLLHGVPGRLTARVVERQWLGDHLQVVGRLQDATGEGPGSALVHHGGAFHTVRPL